MLLGRSTTVLFMLLGLADASLPVHAGDFQPLAIAMVESSAKEYFEPAGRRIAIRKQPIHLFIRIRNASADAVQIRAYPERAYSVELKDQAGLLSMIKRKNSTRGEEGDEILVYLAPGIDKIIPIRISPDTWEGIPVLEAGKESKYSARVIYETADGQQLYSEPYTLVFNISE